MQSKLTDADPSNPTSPRAHHPHAGCPQGPSSTAKTFYGTPLYASRSSLRGGVPSPADDAESLLYALLSMGAPLDGDGKQYENWLPFDVRAPRSIAWGRVACWRARWRAHVEGRSIGASAGRWHEGEGPLHWTSDHLRAPPPTPLVRRQVVFGDEAKHHWSDATLATWARRKDEGWQLAAAKVKAGAPARDAAAWCDVFAARGALKLA